MDKFFVVIEISKNSTADKPQYCAWYRGKIYFPDKSWKDVKTGIALVHITREFDRYGFIAGKVFEGRFECPPRDKLVDYIQQNISRDDAYQYINWGKCVVKLGVRNLGVAYVSESLEICAMLDGEIYLIPVKPTAISTSKYCNSNTVLEYINIIYDVVKKYNHDFKNLAEKLSITRYRNAATKKIPLMKSDSVIGDDAPIEVIIAAGFGWLIKFYNVELDIEGLAASPDFMNRLIYLLYLDMTDEEIEDMLTDLIASVEDYNEMYFNDVVRSLYKSGRLQMQVPTDADWYY